MHLRSTLAPKVMALALAANGMLPSVEALDLPNFTPQANNLFSTWTPLSGPLVRNSDPAFVGSGYDFTGVFWNGVWDAGNVGRAAFLSPIHAAGADHTSTVAPTSVIANQGGDRWIFSGTGSKKTLVTSHISSDSSIATIATHLAPDAGISTYAVPDMADYVGRESFVVGHAGQTSGMSPRVAAAPISSGDGNSTWIITTRDGADATWLRGGDSGGPLFITHSNPAGQNQLLLLGTVYGVSPNSAADSGINYYNNFGRSATINTANQVMAADGFALRLVGQSATTWTGSSSSAYGTGTNWTSNAPLESNYVTFDSALSATQTIDLGGLERSMRGAVFHPGAAGEAFAFENGTLLLGRGGLVNYSTERQLIDAVRLSSPQVWDAVSGGFTVQNGIDLNGNLLLVQGDRDTVFQGVLSGGGNSSLSKYGMGSLTLESAATYSGNTWLYGGTLALAGGGNLPANTRLIIGNNNTSRLELNGKTQLVAALRTVESITGGQATIDLGTAGRIQLYQNSGTDTFAGRISGGTSGTTALEIGGWSVSSSLPTSFRLTGASDFAGQTMIRGSNGSETGGTALRVIIDHPQALGASGPGNETVLHYGTTGIKPSVRFAGSGTFHEDFIVENTGTRTGSDTLRFETGSNLTFAGDFVFSRLAGSATTSQTFDFKLLGNAEVRFGNLTGQLGAGGVAATGTRNNTIWFFGEPATHARMDGVISDGTIAGAGGVGLSMDFRGGTVSLNNTNTYTGNTTIQTGAIILANQNSLNGQSGAFGNSTANLSLVSGQILAGHTVQIGRGITVTAAAGGATIGAQDHADASFTGGLVLNKPAVLLAGNGAKATFSNISHGTAVDPSASKITKEGEGEVILQGSNTHTGGTAVDAGQLRAAHHNALGTAGEVRINGGGTLLVDPGVTLANSSLFVDGGRLINNGTLNGLNLVSGRIGGSGVIHAAVGFTDAATQTLAPGNSPGGISFGGSQNWSGLTYLWEVQDFAETAAPGVGFDTIHVSGTLAFGGSYILEIQPLNLFGSPGALSNFVDQARTWSILSASNGITGFDASQWDINAVAFNEHHQGLFSLQQAGNELVLVFTPVPEPSPAVLALLFGVLWSAFRACRKAAISARAGRRAAP